MKKRTGFIRVNANRYSCSDCGVYSIDPESTCGNCGSKYKHLDALPDGTVVVLWNQDTGEVKKLD